MNALAGCISASALVIALAAVPSAQPARAPQTGDIAGHIAFSGRPPNPAPVINNTCYSFITDKDVVHVDSVHQYSAGKKTFETVPGSGGLSPGPTALEGEYAFAWAKNIWSDMLS